MARQGLLYGLRSTLHQVRRDNAPARKQGLKVSFNEHGRVVDLAIYPLQLQNARHYLIAFEDVTPVQSLSPDTSDTAAQTPKDDRTCTERIQALQLELEANRDYLQSTIQDLEAANEELQSANEEILSSNEELQSTNEELDTAKEELQSTNEELNTVNEELHTRNEELTLANSDLVNLLGNVDIAIVMISTDLRIRRITPKAEEVFNLLPGDINRPIGHIRPDIDCPDLEQMINRVIDRVEPFEREVRDHLGRWYDLHIRPYKSVDNRIDGAVLALVNIDATKRHIMNLQAVYNAILECVSQPMLVLDGRLRVQRLNRGFEQQFEVGREETEGQYIYQLGNGQWDIPELRKLLEKILPERKSLDKILPERKSLDDYRVKHNFPHIGRRVMRLCARAIEDAGHDIGLILLTITDISATDL
jgi:two-component system CheB/CheR fusion protein